MSIYEDVPLEDFRYEEDEGMYYYTCPCGDLFEISLEELHEGEDVALCPSCSLKVRVIFEEAALPPIPPQQGERKARDSPYGIESTIISSTGPSSSKEAVSALESSADSGEEPEP